MSDISIIIVSWNARDYLVDCLRSIADSSRSYSPQIIVVDNNSSDGSPEAVEREFPQVRLIRNSSNLGFARANNLGLRAATGKYLYLINSDIIVLDDCIANMIQFMDNSPAAGIAGPRILNPDMSLQISCRHFPGIWNNLCQVFGLNKLFPKSAMFSEPFMEYWAHDTRRSVDVLSGCFWVVRREALDRVGLLDEDFFIYGEDVDWCKRFNDAGWTVEFNPDARAIHFGGASSANAPVRFYLEMQKADLHYWHKHHGRLGRFAYKMVVLLRQIVRLPAYALTYILRPARRDAARSKLKRALACIRFLFGSVTEISQR